MAYDTAQYYVSIGSVDIHGQIPARSTGTSGIVVDIEHSRSTLARVTAIRKLYSLNSNWDGYGSVAPTDSSLAMAERFVREMPRDKKPVEQIKPDGEGGVSLIWNGVEGRTIMTFDGAELHMSRQRPNDTYDLPQAVPYFSSASVIATSVLGLIPSAG